MSAWRRRQPARVKAWARARFLARIVPLPNSVVRKELWSCFSFFASCSFHHSLKTAMKVFQVNAEICKLTFSSQFSSSRFQVLNDVFGYSLSAVLKLCSHAALQFSALSNAAYADASTNIMHHCVTLKANSNHLHDNKNGLRSKLSEEKILVAQRNFSCVGFRS